MESYNSAGEKILTSFLSYIQFKQGKGDQDYRRIAIEDFRSKKSIDDLYKLSPEQIRAISEYIYMRRYQEGD